MYIYICILYIYIYIHREIYTHICTHAYLQYTRPVVLGRRGGLGDQLLDPAGDIHSLTS